MYIKPTKVTFMLRAVQEYARAFLFCLIILGFPAAVRYGWRRLLANIQTLSKAVASSYLTSLAVADRSSTLLLLLLLGSSERGAVPVLEVLHHLAVPLPLLLRVVL